MIELHTLPMLELRHFRYFRVIAMELHFARAAELLGISQPALSQQVRQIEKIVGGELMERGRRKVVLTALGRVLLEQAEKVVDQSDRAAREIAEAARGQTGRVSVAYVASAALSGVLPRIVYEYRRTRPAVQVSLKEMDMLQQLDVLARGDIDVAFIRPPVPHRPEGLTFFDIMDEPMCVVLHKEHPRAGDSEVDVATLAKDTFICTHRHEGVGFYAITRAICSQAGFDPKTEVFSSQASVLISMVGAGFGVALVPASTQAFAPADVVFRPLANCSIQSSLTIAYGQRNRSPAVGGFVETSQEWARGERPQGLKLDRI